MTDDSVEQHSTPCPLCDGEMREILLDELPDRERSSADRFRIVRCRTCDHRYLDPRPSPAEIGRFYQGDYEPYRNSRRGPKGRLMAWRAGGWARRIGRNLPSGADVLEIGCASGRLLDALRDRRFSPVGLEPSVEAAGIARRHGHAVVVASAEEMEWQPNSFDMIVLIHVIEHVHDPRAVLAKLRRALRPGGRLFLALPNVDSWATRVLAPNYCWDVPRHLQFFTPRTLRRLLEGEGFGVESLRWGRAPVEWIRGISYFAGSPRSIWRKVFAVWNPIWLALLAPLELLASVFGGASRMTVLAAPRPSTEAGCSSPEAGSAGGYGRR